MSDPNMEGNAKDRNGDGIAVSVTADITNAAAAFAVLAGGKVYKFGMTKGLKLTPAGLSVKATFKPSPDQPEDKDCDVDLAVDCLKFG